MNSVLLLILGMMAVTYIPRLFPFLIITKDKLPKFIKRFLAYMPYAMFGALIFPGVLNAIEGEIYISLWAFVTASFVAYRFGGVIWPVLSGIGMALILQLL